MSYFKNTQCDECDSVYDELLTYCPKCGKRNELHADFKSKTKVSFLPKSIELYIFLLGFVGFMLISLAIGLIVGTFMDGNTILAQTIINDVSYVILATILVLLVYRYYREYVSYFKSKRSYVAGLVGFAALTAISYILALIINLINPNIGTGGNQSAATQMVINYPVLSILILGLIGPVCEEITYRLGLYSLLRRKNFALALIVHALVFALIHFDFFSSDYLAELAYFPTYLAAALTFSLVYEKEGIAASTFAHMLNNLFSIVMILIEVSTK